MKNRHRYHPPTRKEIMEAESRLTRSDQRAIRAGIRAATGGVKGDIAGTANFALASAVLTNLPASMENLITAARGTADKVLGDDIHTHILFDLFDGDMVRANEAVEEYDEIEWYLKEEIATTLERNMFAESMLRNLSPDAKIIVMDWIERQLWERDYFEEQAAYVLDLIDADNLSSQPDDGRK
jgi:hypothetical protein